MKGFDKMILELDGEKIPYEIIEGVEYYPIKYVFESYLAKAIVQFIKMYCILIILKE